MDSIMEKITTLLASADLNPPPTPLLIAYIALLLLALGPIYFGSFLSLENQAPEKMSVKDAYMFPVIGSGVLFGLYLLFKYINKDYINVLLSAYFLFFGIAALEATIAPIVLRFIPYAKKKKPYKHVIPIPFMKEPFEITYGDHDIVATIISIALGLLYVLQKHWVSNNILGLAFATQGVSLLPLGSWQVGAILLCGLFVYDIFWVFGTDVMVTVAKNFDAPVKLIFPRDIFAQVQQHSMLGLGDIVIPGIFIALLLRFDYKLSRKKKSFPKPYFYSCFIAYIFGLITTMVVMHTFKAAQPALLYLVPFCLGSSLITALVRGELGKLVAYKEEEPKKKS